MSRISLYQDQHDELYICCEAENVYYALGKTPDETFEQDALMLLVRGCTRLVDSTGKERPRLARDSVDPRWQLLATAEDGHLATIYSLPRGEGYWYLRHFSGLILRPDGSMAVRPLGTTWAINNRPFGRLRELWRGFRLLVNLYRSGRI